MNDFVEKLPLTIISLIAGSFIGAFVNSWWKRPKISLKINGKRNNTFFLKPVDPDLKLNGEVKPLPEIFIQIGFFIYNVGDDTEIFNAQLKYKNPTRYSDWHPFVDRKGGMIHNTTLDSAIGTYESMLGKNKQVYVKKNRKAEGHLIFKLPLNQDPKYLECKLKVYLIKGFSAIKKFRVYG